MDNGCTSAGSVRKLSVFQAWARAQGVLARGRHHAQFHHTRLVVSVTLRVRWCFSCPSRWVTVDQPKSNWIWIRYSYLSPSMSFSCTYYLMKFLISRASSSVSDYRNPFLAEILFSLGISFTKRFMFYVCTKATGVNGSGIWPGTVEPNTAGANYWINWKDLKLHGILCCSLVCGHRSHAPMRCSVGL